MLLAIWNCKGKWALAVLVLAVAIATGFDSPTLVERNTTRLSANFREDPVNEIRYFNGRRWTRWELIVWLSALVVGLALGILAVTNVIGRWALMVAPAVGAAVGLMRYRAETEQNKQVDPNRSERGA
jgi:hypothetical protein